MDYKSRLYSYIEAKIDFLYISSYLMRYIQRYNNNL